MNKQTPEELLDNLKEMLHEVNESVRNLQRHADYVETVAPHWPPVYQQELEDFKNMMADSEGHA